MKVTRTPLTDVIVIEPDVHRDGRGFFVETWKAERYAEHGIPSAFAQDAISRSTKGTVRGLHFQEPNAQGKLIYVLRGTIFDVAVDVRKGSPHYAAWFGVELSDENHTQIWIPPGFAHGFLVLSDVAEVFYKLATPYAASSEQRIRWNDPAIGIRWPLAGDPILSNKDVVAPLLADAPVLPSHRTPR